MRGLLKFTLLAFAFCLNLFSIEFNESTLSGGRDNGYPPCTISGSCFSRNDVTFLGSYAKLGNEIYKVERKFEKIFNLANLKQQGSFFVPQQKSWVSYHVLLNYDSSFEKTSIVCTYDEQFKSLGNCSYSYKEGKGYKKIELSYYEEYHLSGPIATCKPDEHFNTDTKKCERCYLGYSWDPAQNRCYKDCSDPNWNKWGLKDGSCIDCSKEETLAKAWICACKHRLSTPTDPAAYDGAVSGLPLPNGLYSLGCANGESFQVRDPKGEGYNPPKPNPDPKDPDWTGDNNKTDPKPNPNPGGNNGGGNNGGGNNGGSQDNPNPNPGSGDADEKFCKEHPKDPKCKPSPKPGDGNTTIINNNGGGGNGGKDDGKNKDGEAKFNKGDFDDGDLDKERNSLYGGIVKHINDNLSKFDGIRDGIDQFVSNVQLKGFEKVQPSIKGKCPIKKQIPLPNGSSQEIEIDLCESVSPASEISYYAFYVGFAVGGLILFLKLLIFSI